MWKIIHCVPLAHRPMTNQRCVLIALIATVGTASALGAQARSSASPDREGGFRAGATLSYVRPALSDGSSRVWEEVGGTGSGGNIALSLGYDVRQVGVTVALETGEVPIGRRDGTMLAFVAAGHWRPAASIAGWQPVVTAGYVRQAFGSVNVAPSELPPDVGQGSDPNDTTRRPLSLFGNGARVGIGGERALSARFALTVESAMDMVRFDSAGYDEFEYRVRDGGWSTIPRLGVGMRWSPFAR